MSTELKKIKKWTPLLRRKLRATDCAGRTEVKERHSQKETERDTQAERKNSGDVGGLEGGWKEEKSKMTYSEAVRQKSHVI